MISARKYIAKCRQRGYDDEKIRRAVAGKTPALRDAVLAMLEEAAVVEAEAVLEGCGEADLASEVLEVEAVAESLAGEGASANVAPESAAGAAPEEVCAEAVDAVYAGDATGAMAPEDIDDLPPADVFAEAEALEAELGGAEVAFAASDMHELAGEAAAETAAPENEAMPAMETMEDMTAPEEPEMAETVEETVVAEEVDAAEESPVAEVAETAEVADVPVVLDVPESAPKMDEIVEESEIAESAPEMDEAVETPETAAPAQGEAPADLHLTIEEEIFLPENWLSEETAEQATDEGAKEDEENAAPAPASDYVAPRLTLIDCEAERAAAEANEPLALRPPWAIAPEEAEARLAYAAEGEGEVIDFAAKSREISAECWQGASEDFDGVARPAEDVAPLPATKAEEALRGEIITIQRNLVESQDGLKMLEMEAGDLRERLQEREGRLAKQEEEIAYLREMQEINEEKMKNESAAVARMQESLQNTREAGDRLRDENARVLDNLEELRGVLRGREESYAAQSQAFSALQIEYEDLCATRRLRDGAAAATVAAMQSAIADLQRAGTALEGELALARRDLAALRGQAAGRDNAITAQGREIARLRALVEDLSAGADALIQNNVALERDVAARDAALAEQGAAHAAALAEQTAATAAAQGEAAAAREAAKAVEERLSATDAELCAAREKLTESEGARAEIAAKYEDLERDHNVLVSETVPNLQKDKEDLVRMVGEEVERAEEYNNVISIKSRRLSYALATAAAACVAVVLMPVFSMNRLDNHKHELDETYNQKLAQVEATRTAWESERSTLHERLQLLQASVQNGAQKFSAERQQWRGQLTALQTALRTSRQELAASQEQLAQSRAKLAALENSASAQPRTVMASAAMQGPQRLEYNDVTGVEEWRKAQAAQVAQAAQASAAPATARQAQAQPATIAASAVKQDAGVKVVKVRRGEGLSQLLWRVYGVSNPEMVRKVTAFNNLKTDRRGNPLLQIGQEIRLPNLSQNKTAMR